MIKNNFFIFIFIVSQCSRSCFSDELLAVTAIVNHGDTIPSKFYPTDPYKDPAIWQKPLGQLSNLGQQQSFSVGKWLRKRYENKIPFITLHYNASQIYAFAENRDESLMSGQCIMAGLYPPIGDEVWNRKLNWRPTPVHNAPLFLDYYLGRGVPCPAFETELNKVKHGRFLRTHNKEDKNLLEYLSKQTGEHFRHIDQIPTLFNILTVEKDHNLTLPEWTLGVYPNALAKAVLEVSLMNTKNANLTTLSIGPLLHRILHQFNAVRKNNSAVGSTSGDLRKFKLYVANNTVIYDVLHGLKVPSVGIVPFGASLIFELWSSVVPGDLYVKILYKGSSQIDAKIQELKVGGCTSRKCPYPLFNATLSKFAIAGSEWNQQCGNM